MLADLRYRLRALFRRDAMERELADELGFHLEREIEKHMRAGLSRVPPKMTSSMSPPRICLAEVSPMTHFRASTRLDLPQPLGPTIPVRPGSM